MPEYDANAMNTFNDQVVANFRENAGAVTIDPFRGSPMLLLHSVGAKSGRARVTPLVYTRDDDRLVIIASNGGAPTHPAWYHNLRAHPETTIEVGADTVEVSAEALADGPERQRLFDRMAAQMPGFADYQKGTSRLIPVVVLHRR